MRNTYAGACYRCGMTVPPGEGHFEKHRTATSNWRTQHADCAIRWRGQPAPTREVAAREHDAHVNRAIRAR